MIVLMLLTMFAIVDSGLFGGRIWSVGVRGRLMCGNRPAVGVNVALYDRDDGMIRL